MTTTDADLVRAFAAGRSQPAFAELVRRHGPLVRGVCRRVLVDAPEADDAFQAVFLVLARKAGGLRDPGRLGPWLYGVAVRAAGKARAARLRRQRRERPMGDPPAPEPDSDWADVRPVLDAEVARLPAKLREALVLCELQGVTREDAATRLGVPAGTLSSRLARAKDELRRRLTRRGLTLSAAGLGTVLAEAGASAAVPLEVIEDTTAAAVAVPQSGGSLVGKLVLMLLAAGGLTAAGIGLVTGDPAADDRARLQGRWVVVSAKLGSGRDHPEKGLAGGTVEFAGDRVTIHRVGSDGKPQPETSGFTLDPSRSPKWIDVSQGWVWDRKTLPGLYELTADGLTLVFVTPPKPRPTTLTPAADDPSTMVLALRRPAGGTAPAAKPDPAAERAKLQGWWALDSMALVGGPKPRPFDDSWLHIDGDRWTTGYTDLDGKPQRTLYRLTLDPAKSPGCYDIQLITPDGTPVRPRPTLGVYELAGDTLTVAQAQPPHPRPAGVTPETAGKDNYIYRYRRAAGPVVAKPRPDPAPTTLRGRWVVRSALYDGKPPAKDFPLVGKTVELTDDRFDVFGQARYVLYPKAKPAQIDLTVLDGPEGVRGDKIEGVYKREGDAVVVHLAADDDQARPTGFECKPGGKTTLVVLEPVAGPPRVEPTGREPR